MKWRYAAAVTLVGLMPMTVFSIIPNFGEDNDFVGVGSLGASCVAVAPHWVMTAKHVGGMTVTINGLTATAVQRDDHPTSDISLLRFDETFSTYYTPDFRDMIGLQVTLVGFGGTGDAGPTGVNITGGGGVRRKGTNIIDRTNTVTFNNIDYFDSWEMDLDGPTGNGSLGGNRTTNEAGLWFGDSGGAGLFLDESNQWRLVGINSYIDDDPNSINGNYSDWGDLSGIVRLKSYQPWIEERIGTVPEPASLTVLLLGILALRRRNR